MQATLRETIKQYARDEESAEALKILFEQIARQPAVETLETINYDDLCAVLSEGVVIHDMTGAIVRANTSAERILGLTFEQMTGRTSVDPRWRAIHPNGSPFPGDTHPAMITIANGTPQHDVIMGIYKPDDSLTWLKVNTHLMHAANSDQQIGVIAIFSNITESYQDVNRFDYRLEQERSRILSTFLRDATHEFRTPLSTIKTKAYILPTFRGSFHQKYRISVWGRRAKLQSVNAPL
ncbi:MAG: PAS domain-containing protein [Anaerolineae bacterium]